MCYLFLPAPCCSQHQFIFFPLNLSCMMSTPERTPLPVQCPKRGREEAGSTTGLLLQMHSRCIINSAQNALLQLGGHRDCYALLIQSGVLSCAHRGTFYTFHSKCKQMPPMLFFFLTYLVMQLQRSQVIQWPPTCNHMISVV